LNKTIGGKLMKIAKRKYKPLKEGKYDIRRDDVFKIVFGSNER